MKIKSRPEDFVVEEFLELPEFTPEGSYVIYKLEKRGLSTLEVVELLARRYKIPDRDISFAGLKDKYAHTTQYLSMRVREARAIKERNFGLSPLGRSTRPVGPDLLSKNKFRLTLRDLEKDSVENIIISLDQVSKYGFPNYFGEQRFGSVRHGGEFLAKLLIHEDYEGALKLYLSRWSTEDRAVDKKFKRFVLSHWGDWDECLRVAGRNRVRAIISYLRDHPGAFLNAINMINPRLLFLYVAAYQSYLWNEMASEFIKTDLNGVELIRFRYKPGEMVFYKKLPDKLFDRFIKMEIPLIDHKVEFSENSTKEIAEKVLSREGIAIQEFRLKKLKRAFFKSAPRKLIVFPEELEISDIFPDEIYKGKFKLTLSFFLPSGSYASVLLRRIEDREIQKVNGIT
ncbi:MAG TPA: tRNA pseudouridine(13) synthase TruD [Thermodesulfobacteriota bacterium]|nr:tRNA pseudouridine(13) synthase TruD [Thermodesulfobacteriota bacterium]